MISIMVEKSLKLLTGDRSPSWFHYALNTSTGSQYEVEFIEFNSNNINFRNDSMKLISITCFWKIRHEPRLYLAHFHVNFSTRSLAHIYIKSSKYMTGADVLHHRLSSEILFLIMIYTTIPLECIGMTVCSIDILWFIL